MITRRTITGILFAVALFVWGLIAYRIYKSVHQGDNVVERGKPEFHPATAKGVRYIYRDDVRDPFQCKMPHVRDTLAKKMNIARRTALPWSPPPVKVGGVLTSRDKKKKTIVLESAGGTTYFLNEGDTLQGIRILKILDTAVSYEYQDRRSQWLVNR